MLTQLGPKANMKCRGVLSVVVNTPEMHIPPWYWFSHWTRASLAVVVTVVLASSEGLPGLVLASNTLTMYSVLGIRLLVSWPEDASRLWMYLRGLLWLLSFWIRGRRR